MSHPWMPFYVADYLADTGHLSTCEHGAYMLLIMHYWQKGGLPNDEVKLARICRMDPPSFAQAMLTLREFFDIEWHHARIDLELSKASEKHARRAEAGRRGGLVKPGSSNAQAMLKPGSSDGGSNALASSSQPQSERKKDAREARDSLDLEFEEWWKANENRVGKPAALVAYRKARSKAKAEALLDGVKRYIRSKPPDVPWCHPANWLDKERWLDCPAGSNDGPKRPPYVFIEEGTPEHSAWAQIGMVGRYKNPKNTSQVGMHVPSRWPNGNPA